MFNNVKAVTAAVFCVAAIALIFAPIVRADDWDKKTVVTFSRPIEIPGKVLPAGTYMFQVMDFLGSRNVIRITDEYGVKVYATLFGIWDLAYEAPEDTRFTFYEAPKGSPEALHEWFYPGHRYGFEFVYPENRAVEIAEITGIHVLAEAPRALLPPRAEPPTVQELLTEPIVAVEPGGKEVAVEEVYPPEPEAQIAEVIPETTAPEPEPALTELPKTASPLPLIGLIGIISGVAATAIRRLRG